MFNLAIKIKSIFREIITILLFSFLIVSHSSVINPFSGDNSNDSWIFRYMGMLIAKGGIPYKDAFDQKGPLLYLIEYIGYMINKESGIWYIELCSMIIFLFIIYLLCKKITNSKTALICSLASVGSLSLFFNGNMSEEYALPFIAYSIYVFTDYFLFKDIIAYRIILCGCCFGAIVMLKPNMISLWAVMCIGVIIEYLYRNKQFPIKLTLLFTAGASVVIAPFFLYFQSHDAISDFIYQYFTYNFQYSESIYSISDLIKSIFSFSNSSMVIIPMTILIFTSVKDRKNRFFNILYILYIIINLTLCSLSVRGYLHYGMPLVPMHAYPLAIMTKYIQDNRSKHQSIKYIPYAVFTLYSITLILFISKNIVSMIQSANNTYTYSDYSKLASEIINLTDPDDTIFVWGYSERIYYESDRLCSSKYFIKVPFDEIVPSLKEDIVYDLNSNPPQLIVSPNTDVNSDFKEYFLHFNDYSIANQSLSIYILK